MQITIGEASIELSDWDGETLPPEVAAKVKFLTHLYVAPGNRRQGHATRLMKQLAEEADQAQIALIVEPKPYDDSEIEQDQLNKFYEKHGFTELQQEPFLMVRFPIPATTPEPKKSALAIVDAYGRPFH